MLKRDAGVDHPKVFNMLQLLWLFPSQLQPLGCCMQGLLSRLGCSIVFLVWFLPFLTSEQYTAVNCCFAVRVHHCNARLFYRSPASCVCLLQGLLFTLERILKYEENFWQSPKSSLLSQLTTALCVCVSTHHREMRPSAHPSPIPAPAS